MMARLVIDWLSGQRSSGYGKSVTESALVLFLVVTVVSTATVTVGHQLSATCSGILAALQP